MTYVYFSGGSSKAKDALPISCRNACAFATSLLEALSQQIIKGDINIEDLKIIYGNIDQMKRLCESVEADKSNSSLKQNKVTSVVEQRLQEFNAFQELLGKLQYLCQMIPATVDG